MNSTTPLQTCLRLLAFGILALQGQAESLAATQVSGIIAGQTWTANGSPYEVTSDLLVGSLQIGPGVEVKLMGNYVVEVAGSLRAIGAHGDMIHFRPASAGLGWKGIFFNESQPGSVLEYCRIEGSKNGGVRILNTIPVIRHNVIAGNTTTNHGWGGAIAADVKSGRLLVQSCVITNNRVIGAASDIAGGGGLAIRSGTMVVSNTLLAGNVSDSAGGALWAQYGQLIVANSLIVSNRSTYGGGIRNDGSAIQVNNCTIAMNQSDAFSLCSGSLAVSNSIVYKNGTGSWLSVFCPADVTVAYSYTQGEMAQGPGNIISNPVIDPSNWRLIQGSPCIDGGSPAATYNDSCVPPSMGGARNDMGVFGGPGACLGVGLGSDDSDGDGLPDTWEIEYFGTITSQNATGDADQDKLTNVGEYKAGTNPTKTDTDGDGYSDFAEIRSQSDPLDPKSIPPADLILTVEQVRLEFVAGMNEKIAIQGSTDLTEWTDVELITGTGEIVTRIYNVSDGQRYFKTVRR